MRINSQKIKLLMKKQGLTQESLQKRSGISERICTLLIRETCSIDVADKVANALGVSVEEIAMVGYMPSNTKFCPLTFPAGIHLPCRSDCAWYMKSEECCAVGHIATCQNFVSGNIEEIATRIHDATT